MRLLIGYGNPGRGDDGLGPAFVERIEARGLPDLDTKIDYQLKVEHAPLLVGASAVVFVDAWMGEQAPFRFSPVRPAGSGDVTSHSLSPATVLTLAGTLFGATPEAHLLAITGADFGRVHEGLSPVAQDNLDRAEAFFIDWIAAGWQGGAAVATQSGEGRTKRPV